MGDIILGVDFKAKKRVEAPVQTEAPGLSLDTPPEVLLTIYESSIGFIPYYAPEKDPA